MSTLPAPSGPLDREPVSVHPPYTRPPCYQQDRTECYVALLTALGDLELGSYDVRVLGWLAARGTVAVAVVGSLLQRSYAAGRDAGRREAGTAS